MVAPSELVANVQLSGNPEQQRSPEAAFSWYMHAVQLNPTSLSARRGYARMLDLLGRGEEAAEFIHQTLKLEPDDVESLNHLACLHYRVGNLSDAARLFKQSLEADPDCAATWLHLGCAFVASKQLLEAEESFRRVTCLDKEDSDGWLNLSNVLRTQHRVEEAAAAFRQASRRLPIEPLRELWPSTLCPAVFQSNAEIDEYRERLRVEIDRFREQRLSLTVKDVGAVASPPPLNLPFQGREDRHLLEAYASIFDSLEKPGFLKKPRFRSRPSIGFVVTAGHEAIFQRFLGGVLNRLTSCRFNLVVVCQATGVAYFRSQLTNPAIRVLPIPYEFHRAVTTIYEQGFDVLYHWETGTDVTNYFLPFLRLASIQCTSFGNSETSGNSRIDYFLSSSLYEPPKAEKHYAEKLILINGLGNCGGHVSAPFTRNHHGELGVTPDQHLYVCAQKPQKIHPDFDPILARILRCDPRGVVVLVEDEYKTAGNLLRRRFQSTICDVADRILFQPRLTFSHYLSLLAAADVLLDPLHYGGGMTMFDALSLGRPVVTLPGEFARGRYALACYRQMGIAAPVAESADDYVEIAVRLATERDFRVTLENIIGERGHVLFDENAVAAEYQQTFERLIAEARAA